MKASEKQLIGPTTATWITISSIYLCFSPGHGDEEREQLQSDEAPNTLPCLTSLISNSHIF